MIITTLQALGRETVVEYSPTAAWSSWGIEREGEWDTFLFLGKFSLVHTNHWRRKPHYAIRVAATLTGLLLAATTANAVGSIVSELIAPTPPPHP